ncbi:DUF2887 domain-containing protein [Plectonema radiosum]|uniref:DUF2887 domain-containing protein n=1 Tax=Plectonema radiosum TaxID=945768 RepID=UPI002AD3C774|nr:DUF2887 domain-containing protein [Plectonema radiosum]
MRYQTANGDRYSFDSVAVKEPKFEIDGVFLPPQSDGAGIVYFVEVQSNILSWAWGIEKK